MSQFRRIHYEQDSEIPLPIDVFLAQGVPGQNATAIVAYDELYALVRETGRTMEPFVVESVSSAVKDDELVTIRVKAGALRKLNSAFRNVKF